MVVNAVQLAAEKDTLPSSVKACMEAKQSDCRTGPSERSNWKDKPGDWRGIGGK
jgi:hypothetical protein